MSAAAIPASKDVRTLFVDTQGLIYAFERKDPSWLDFIDARLAEGYRLVMAEEHLYEFGKSGTLNAALALTQQAVERKPVWIRNFLDLEIDEVCRFALHARARVQSAPIQPFVETFHEVSQIGETHKLAPEDFVRFSFNPKTINGLADLASDHADVLNALSSPIVKRQFTKALNDTALRAALQGRLERGSRRMAPIAPDDLHEAVQFCVKHHKRLLSECPAYATEHHLSNYRTSNPKRKARLSDSMDLMLAVAAFPYVSTLITNDGYLYNGLSYVQKQCPDISTELLRIPQHTIEPRWQ